MKRKQITKTMFVTSMALLLGLSTACSNSNSGSGNSGSEPAKTGNSAATDAPKEIVELKAITMGNEPKSGLDTFYKELDALTEKDLGIRVRFDYIPWGDEKNQISRAIAAKEYDLYVGGAWSDFANFATKNAFADLTPLLEETPDLVEHYKGSLDRVKIDGKVFGIPQYNKPGGGGEGMLYREDLRQKWGLPEISSLETAEQYLYKAKEEYPSTPMLNDKRFGTNIYSQLIASKYYTVAADYAVAAYDDPYKIISIYDTPEYKEAVAKAKQWYDDGIVDHDVLAAQGNATAETLELMKVDQKPLEFNNHFGAVSNNYINQLKEALPDSTYGWYDFLMDNNAPAFLPRMSPSTITMISVGANSQYALQALKLIEKAHTDPTYYNLLAYGVEGENYNLDGEGFINYEGIPTDNIKPAWTGLADGYMALQVKYPGEWKSIYDELQAEGIKRSEAGGTDPYEGFSFDTSSLATELSNLETVKTQYIQPLSVGMTNDIGGDLAKVQKQLKDAGFDAYLAELQKQVDAFKASK
ncbi:extracellular solute-binding protein [Paenibacillus sp. FSL R7-0345]|uniref:extracellular solute-binding protein n=1 Tax=Paenibacillus sp. FSL R7-0345 TaxID=2954535 RepID=UPI00315A2196